MRNILKGLLILIIAVALTGCNGEKESFKETENYTSENLIELIEDTYENIATDVPLVETKELTTEIDRALLLTGLKSMTNVEAIVASNAQMSTVPYSYVLIKVKSDADIQGMKQEIIDNVDLRYWICVQADIAYVTNYGSIIALIMGEATLADKVYNEFDRITGPLGEKLIKESDNQLENEFDGGFDGELGEGDEFQ